MKVLKEKEKKPLIFGKDIQINYSTISIKFSMEKRWRKWLNSHTQEGEGKGISREIHTGKMCTLVMKQTEYMGREDYKRQ